MKIRRWSHRSSLGAQLKSCSRVQTLLRRDFFARQCNEIGFEKLAKGRRFSLLLPFDKFVTLFRLRERIVIDTKFKETGQRKNCSFVLEYRIDIF